MYNPITRATTFVGGNVGAWLVVSQRTLLGAPITAVTHVDIIKGVGEELPQGAKWALTGVTTNERYTTREEKSDLTKKQAPLGRSEATCSTLTFLRKNADWWALSQDERRKIFEEDSHHIAIGRGYLPAIARFLLHCRDLGANAPFDFIGFLDYSPSYIAAYDEMLGKLRSTIEWTFMEREIDIRLERVSG